MAEYSSADDNDVWCELPAKGDLITTLNYQRVSIGIPNSKRYSQNYEISDSHVYISYTAVPVTNE